MLNRHARGFFTALFTPLARWLLKIGISPDAVTVIGTAGVVVGALVFYPLGQLWWGTLFITAFIFSDVLDGIMARMREVGSRWGNFLDSTLDRIADGAEDMVRRIRAVSPLPIALGFGISTPEHVREVGQWADAAVVGSALVNVIAEAGASPELTARVEEYVRWLKS